MRCQSLKKQNSTYEVYEQSLNPPSSPIRDTNYTSVTSNDIVDDVETGKSNSVFNDTLSIGQELTTLVEEQDKVLGNMLKEKVLSEIKCDLKSRFFKHHAAKLLDETYGERLSDGNFFRWLAKQLDYKIYRLRKILDNYELEMKPRRTLSENQYQQIHDFGLNEEVSIPNADHRTGRNEVKIEKLRYMRECKHQVVKTCLLP